jgi:hypothetical protein
VLTWHTTSVLQALQMFLAATPQAAPMLPLLPPAPNFLAVVPIDIDAVWWRTTHLQTCYQCGQ